MGKKVECGRGATREKYRYYGQIFLKTVIIVSNVPHTVTKKILKTQQKKSTGFVKKP
jgi:hypothetical protein